LPPTRLALGGISPEYLPDASALFNLMRNLGGAIGLALIDTVIWGRSPTIAKNLGEDLLAGDSKVATLIGLPPGLVTGPVAKPVDPAVEAIVQPLIQKAALTQAINEAWAMLACAMIVAFMLALIVPATRRPTQIQAAAA
jgi:DHA2 family multidrug resistance protein